MLERHRYDLIIAAGRKLDKARMVRFEEKTGFLHSTDLGRIASHFYIKYDTVEVGPWLVGCMACRVCAGGKKNCSLVTESTLCSVCDYVDHLCRESVSSLSMGH